MQLDPQEARELFASARVRRSDDRVDLIPFVFAWLPTPEPLGRLVSAVDHKPKRTADLARLRNIAAEPRVSVLADAYDEDWSQLWWARLDGTAEVLDGGGAAEDAIGLLRARYVQYTDAPPDGPVIAVTATSWSGWRA